MTSFAFQTLATAFLLLGIAGLALVGFGVAGMIDKQAR